MTKDNKVYEAVPAKDIEKDTPSDTDKQIDEPVAVKVDNRRSRWLAVPAVLFVASTLILLGMAVGGDDDSSFAANHFSFLRASHHKKEPCHGKHHHHDEEGHSSSEHHHHHDGEGDYHHHHGDGDYHHHHGDGDYHHHHHHDGDHHHHHHGEGFHHGHGDGMGPHGAWGPPPPPPPGSMMGPGPGAPPRPGPWGGMMGPGGPHGPGMMGPGGPHHHPHGMMDGPWKAHMGRPMMDNNMMPPPNNGAEFPMPPPMDGPPEEWFGPEGGDTVEEEWNEEEEEESSSSDWGFWDWMGFSDSSDSSSDSMEDGADWDDEEPVVVYDMAPPKTASSAYGMNGGYDANGEFVEEGYEYMIDELEDFKEEGHAWGAAADEGVTMFNDMVEEEPEPELIVDKPEMVQYIDTLEAEEDEEEFDAVGEDADMIVNDMTPEEEELDAVAFVEKDMTTVERTEEYP